MIDLVQRLRFDATRCEATFSKGVAGNIEEAANRIEKLEKALHKIAYDEITIYEFGPIARTALAE